MRGLSYIEVEVTGPNRDLHSGVYGGAVANPITILAKMIAICMMKIIILPFRVFMMMWLNATDEERKLMAEAPFDEEEYKNDLGVKELWGEKGYTTNERTGIRPTLELNGIWGGYMGEGAKTVLPSKALQKFLQDWCPTNHQIRLQNMLSNHFKKIAPPYVTVKAL